MDHEVLGFSPELVMAVRGRKVCTQPLAGTHILTGNADDAAAIRNELVTDPKEIAEHSMTVVAAVNDIRLVSEKGSEKVDDFMYVSERGNVQHLASMVTGTLSEDKDIWDAFDNLFPSVTACGSPKEKVIEVILRKEKHSRGLYSGAVLMINEKEFEASMVLRSVHQQPGKSWLQAGAGIFELSTPEREFRETSNKLKSLAPHIVFETE
jgi:salicylate synthetase